MAKVLAVIPARSGSKSVKDKNIRPMLGKPLLAYSIEQALASRTVDRVLVSTDCEEYAVLARQYGAETPFLRPAGISGDRSLDIELFEHVLEWLQAYEGGVPDILVHLRPTHPIRQPNVIDDMVTMLLDDPALDSVRSVSPARQTPYKMWLMNGGCMTPVATCDVPEAYNSPRQALPQTWMQNACVDVVRSRVILEQRSMTGRAIGGYAMDIDFDIDTEEEFVRAEQYLLLQQAAQGQRRLQICCDIDGVLARKTPGNDYALAGPIPGNIEIINRAHAAGYRVVLFTARGSATGIDWRQTTADQMAAWGVCFDELRFGKPAADIYIDDHNGTLEDLQQLIAAGATYTTAKKEE